MLETEKIDCNQSQQTEVKFVAGGNVQAGDGYYISREADEQLLELCKASRFANVLAPRQLGKSSLMNHTAECLFEQGIQSVIIDLSPLGKRSTEEIVWYGNLLHEIGEQLEIKFNFDEWKKKYDDLGATKMLELFLRDIVLSQIKEPVVIFLDEIDSTINLTFKDDFFAAIRYFYQLRTRLPEFHRLSFVLIGVATPGDLIGDIARTPFNLGERVSIKDFSLEEALPLAMGFELPDEHAREVLGWVMKWTNGHPYLTMRLCKIIAEKKRESWTADEINKLVESTFLGEEGVKDNNIQFVSKMLLERLPAEVEPGELLINYQDVWRGKSVTDNDYSIIKAHLKLSGIVYEVKGFLKVRNEIYAKIFDDNWIKEHLPETWVRLQYRKRFKTIVALSALVLILTALSTYAVYQSRQASKNAELAEMSATEANMQKDIAKENAKEAVKQTKLANEKVDEAIEHKKIAEAEKNRADKSRLEAIEAAKNEKLARQRAEELTIKAEKAAEKEREATQTALERQKKLEKLTSELEVATKEAEIAAEEAIKQKEIAVKNAKEAIMQTQVAQEAVIKLERANEDLAKKIGLEKLEKITKARLWSTKAEQIVPFLKAEQIRENKPQIGVLIAAESIKLARQYKMFPWEVNADLPLRRGLAAVSSVGINPDPITVKYGSQAKTSVLLPNFHVLFADSNHNLFTQPFEKPATPGLGNLRTNFPSNIDKIIVTNEVENIVTVNDDNRIYFVDADKANNHIKSNVIEIRNNEPKDFWKSFPFTNGIKDVVYNYEARRFAVATGNEIQFIRHQPNVDAKQTQTKPSSNGEFVIADPPLIHKKNVLSVDFNSDGKYVVTADGDEARIWDVENRVELAHTEGEDGDVTSAVFSSDGLFIATTGSSDNKVRVWNVSDGRKIITPQQTVTPIEYSPRSTQSEKFEKSAILKFSPDNNSIIIGSNGRTVLVKLPERSKIDAPNSVADSKSEKNFGGQLEDVQFSPDSRYVLTAFNNGLVKLWDVSSGRLQSDVNQETGVKTVGFGGANDFIYTLSGKTARIWRIKGEAEKIPAIEFGNSFVNSAYNKNKKLIATAHNDRGGTVNLWKAEAKEQKPIYQFSGQRPNVINLFAFSSDGNYLAAAGIYGDVRIVDLSSSAYKEKLLPNLTQAESRINSIALNNKGSLIAVSKNNDSKNVLNSIDIFNIESGERIPSIDAEGTSGKSDKTSFDKVLFNPQNETQLATVRSDGVIQLWEIKPGTSPKEIGKPKNAESRVADAAFNANGAFIAVSTNTNIKIFRSDEEQEIKFEKEIKGSNSVLAWSENGDFLAAANGNDAEIFSVTDIYDNEPGKKRVAREFLRIKHNSTDGNTNIINLNFSVDSQGVDSQKVDRLITVGTDGFARFWLWREDDLIKDACQQLSLKRLDKEVWENNIGGDFSSASQPCEENKK